MSSSSSRCGSNGRVLQFYIYILHRCTPSIGRTKECTGKLGRSGPNLESGTVVVYAINGLNIGRKVPVLEPEKVAVR